jgi:metal-responsive CopG/Arc/MetJ family transcriptional regulator
MSRLLSVAISDALMRDLESAARSQGTTKSEVVRAALRRELQVEKLRDLQRYGRLRAEERGVGPEDVEALVDEVRRTRG